MKPWPFAGRGAELARVRERLRAGIGTLLLGEPGAGRTALVRRLRGEALVVDDAHRLTEAAARELLEAAAGGTTVVATAPRGHPLPVEVERLWRDGHCDLMLLTGLTDAGVTEVLEEFLDGAPDPATVATLTAWSQGSPRLLRELVTASLDTGRLTRLLDRWSLTGPPAHGTGATQLVGERLDRLDRVRRAALETVAITEPLPTTVAVALVGARRLERLEQSGLVAVRETPTGPTVATAHPLDGEVIRERMPTLRRHRLRLAAAAALEPAGDLVRAALWRLEAGQPDPPERLLAAAEAARAGSLAAAERLARAAGADTAAMLLLAEILTLSGRADEATVLTTALAGRELRPDQHARLTFCTALTTGLLAGDVSTAATLVGHAPVASTQLRALHSFLLAVDGHYEDAIAAGQPVADDASADPTVRLLAGCGVVGAEYWRGRTRQAVTVARRLPAAADEGAWPAQSVQIDFFVANALVDEGRLDEADRAVRRLDQAASPFAAGRAAYCAGEIARLRGRHRTAAKLLRRSLAAVQPLDRVATGLVLAALARSLASMGDPAGARVALHGLDHPLLATLRPEWMVAEAAIAAATLRLDDAVSGAIAAATTAATLDQWGLAARAYHDAARYGAPRPVRAPLRQAVERVDGPLVRCYERHVAALADRDAALLVEVSRAFEELGLLHFAAEAAAEAALTQAAGGQARLARASGERASQLFGACENAASPWLAGAPAGVALTPRERQVAALAGAGHADAQIAGQLGISARTVSTHLARVYAKLGLTRRTQLSSALSPLGG